MKKILFSVILILFFAVFAFAETITVPLETVNYVFSSDVDTVSGTSGYYPSSSGYKVESLTKQARAVTGHDNVFQKLIFIVNCDSLSGDTTEVSFTYEVSNDRSVWLKGKAATTVNTENTYAGMELTEQWAYVRIKYTSTANDIFRYLWKYVGIKKE